MGDLDANSMLGAFRRLGEVLRPRWRGEAAELVLMGSAAGIFAGWLPSSRVTTDCDVVLFSDDAAWEIVAKAVTEVARERELPESWLNDAARIYLWCLPLGWRSRCEFVVTAGPLRIVRLGRGDLIGAKVIAGRTQDLEDLGAMRPSDEELDRVDAHIDRLEREDLGERSFDDARAIVLMLRDVR